MNEKNPLFVLKHETAGEPLKAKVGNKTITLKHVNDLDQFALSDLFADEKVTDLALMTRVIRMALSEDDMAVLAAAKPTRVMVQNLFIAYEQHCGVRAGESPASSD